MCERSSWIGSANLDSWETWVTFPNLVVGQDAECVVRVGGQRDISTGLLGLHFHGIDPLVWIKCGVVLHNEVLNRCVVVAARCPADGGIALLTRFYPGIHWGIRSVWNNSGECSLRKLRLGMMPCKSLAVI